jgi:16S rRNA (cytidine1402-2'-O)-methyltransferase
MKDHKSEESSGKANGSGCLNVVGTPIGNLEDITLRALRILKEVHLIAAENTNHTKALCNHYGIRTKLTSYNQHNCVSKGRELIRILKSGTDVALVTSAGTPGISDPGSLLVTQALEEGLSVTPIPGPSAVISALSVCGLKVDRFVFLGFLPDRPGKRKRLLLDMVHESRTMVFYESPRRVSSLLKELLDALGDRKVAVIRELTKVYEEIKKGVISTVLEEMNEENLKGEFTIILEGEERKENLQASDLDERIEELLKTKKSGAKDIATALSEELGVSYRLIYKRCLDLMRGSEITSSNSRLNIV